MTINRLTDYKESFDQLYSTENVAFSSKALAEIKDKNRRHSDAATETPSRDTWIKLWNISEESSKQFTDSVKRLSANDFATREESQKRLRDQRALPWLRDALGSSEQETRIRARDIIRKFVTNNRIASDFGSTLDDYEVLPVFDLPKLIPLSKALESGDIKRQIASLDLLQECVKHPGSEFVGDYAERVLNSLHSESSLLAKLSERGGGLKSLTIKQSAPILGEEAPIKRLMTLGSISQVDHLNLSDLSASDATIDHLPVMKKLKSLNISCSTLSADGLDSMFLRFPNLENLDIRDSITTKETLKEVGRHSRLKSLAVGWGTRTHVVSEKSTLPTGIKDQDFKALANLSELEHLQVCLDYTDAITDDGMTVLEKMTKLKSLYVSNAELSSGESLKLMQSLPDLERLSLIDCKVTDRGLANLSNADHLQRLTIRGGEFSQDGLKACGTLINLRELDLKAFRFTPGSLHHLNNLSKLTKLTLKWSSITDGDVAAISKIKSLTNLDLSESHYLTDKSVDYLKEMKNLKVLDLAFSNISSPKLEELRSALPDCKISPGRARFHTR